MPVRSHHRPATGFTLIELMVTVAIIAILAAVALPSYSDYILRGRIADATKALLSRRAAMEQYFQDQRSYDAPSSKSIAYPCASDAVVADKSFTISCNVGTPPTSTAYTITATGSGPANGFAFTIDQNGTQTTTAMPSAWGKPPAACWIKRKGDTC